MGMNEHIVPGQGDDGVTDAIKCAGLKLPLHQAEGDKRCTGARTRCNHREAGLPYALASPRLWRSRMAGSREPF